MRIKLWDVSWTGGRHNERDVATCLDLVTYAADRGYRIVKATAGTGTWNLLRGGVLVAVAEIGEPDRTEVFRGTWASTQPSVQNIPKIETPPYVASAGVPVATPGKLARYRHLLRKPAAICFVS